MTQLPLGSWPVMVTPFRDDRSIDWAAVDALVEFYLAAGSAGLFAVAQTSEMYALSEEERMLLAERVVKRVEGRVPVVATGTFGDSVDAQLESIRRTADTGVTAVIAVTSQVAGPHEGDTVLRDRLLELAGRAPDVALGLYECPLPYKRLLALDVIADVAASNRFVFLKDTTERPAVIRQRLERIAGTALRLYNAEFSSLLESVGAGAHGFCGNATNMYPELAQWLCTAEADDPEAQRIQRAITVADAVMSSPLYPASAKYFLGAARGLPISPVCRVTSAGLGEHDRRLLDQAHAHVRELALPVELV